MKCILMNKNMPIVELELDEDTATILKVMKTYELDFLPIGNQNRIGEIKYPTFRTVTVKVLWS